eukprot:929393-Pleurochrysis_carterae.AAC.1
MRWWDFAVTYLQGSLDPGEVVYCSAPPGFSSRDGYGVPRICRIDKPVYGMAQAGRRWQRSLFPWLREQSFQQSESDPCSFTSSRLVNDVPQTVIVGCYVDDLFTLYSHDGPGTL